MFDVVTIRLVIFTRWYHPDIPLWNINVAQVCTLFLSSTALTTRMNMLVDQLLNHRNPQLRWCTLTYGLRESVIRITGVPSDAHNTINYTDAGIRIPFRVLSLSHRDKSHTNPREHQTNKSQACWNTNDVRRSSYRSQHPTCCAINLLVHGFRKRFAMILIVQDCDSTDSLIIQSSYHFCIQL